LTTNCKLKGWKENLVLSIKDILTQWAVKLVFKYSVWCVSLRTLLVLVVSISHCY